MAIAGVEAQIADAIFWYVGQIVLNPVLPVAYEGTNFNLAVGTPYLSVNIMPNTASNVGVDFDSNVDHQGMLQASVFWPSAKGLIKPLSVASQIVTAFKPGTIVERNGIRVLFNERPKVASSLQESDWLQVPVTVRWRVFAMSNA